jgi:Dihydrodipicolinate reductase, N-terminus./VIT family.
VVGLIDGSLSTLAPIFGIAIYTHKPHTAFIAGLATAVGAGISMAFSEGLSDTGEFTGRGSPLVRGSITGVGTFIGGILHTLPFLISTTTRRSSRPDRRRVRADRARRDPVAVLRYELPPLVPRVLGRRRVIALAGALLGSPDDPRLRRGRDRVDGERRGRRRRRRRRPRAGCRRRAQRPGAYSSVAEALDAVPVDVLVDYTHAAAVKGNVLAALERGVGVVVGHERAHG